MWRGAGAGVIQTLIAVAGSAPRLEPRSPITGGGAPFALSAPSVTTAAAGLVLLGLVCAGTAVARIASIDPATALGGNR